MPATSAKVTGGGDPMLARETGCVDKLVLDVLDVLVGVDFPAPGPGPGCGALLSFIRSKRRARLLPSFVMRSSIVRVEGMPFRGVRIAKNSRKKRMKGANLQSSPNKKGVCATGIVVTLTCLLSSNGVSVASPFAGKRV